MSKVASAAPLGDLVGPGGAELRAAQTFRVLRRKGFRHRAIRPLQTPARRNPDRPLVPVIRGKEAGDAFDHHFAYVVLGFADERDAAHGPVGIFKITEREPPHPFGAGARLAGTAAAENEPSGPGLAAACNCGRLLMVVDELRPVVGPAVNPSRLLRRDQLLLFFGIQLRPFFEQVLDGNR
jgi:hypothetical protein